MILPEGESKDFLGYEFLTWLWYCGETTNWSLDLGEKGALSFAMDDLLVMEPDDPDECSQKLSGIGPTRSPEASVSLLHGKKVKVARLIFVSGEKEWSVTIRADKFHFSSLKLMPPDSTDAEERFAEFTTEMEEVMQLFDALYVHFLKVRLNDNWHKLELPKIQAWVQEKNESNQKNKKNLRAVANS